MTSQEKINKYNVKFVAKKDSLFMKIINVLLKCIGNETFMTNFWTTIGRTIYYPDYVKDPLQYEKTLKHELVHVEQWDKYWLFYPISYLLFPVPILFAWFRWRWEREAFLYVLKEYKMKIFASRFMKLAGIENNIESFEEAFYNKLEKEIDYKVNSLWNNYLFPWPKSWMKKWFVNQLVK